MMLFESMVLSVLCARDRWLKPVGNTFVGINCHG
jgi:hypothetical protein